MQRRIGAGLMIAAGVLLSQKLPSDNGAPSGQEMVVEGLVRDIACPIQNKQSTAERFNLNCAIQCAKLGSPLVILSKDGSLYIPISGVMPDKDQRSRLMPYVGKYVKAKGRIYERAGTKAIVISGIAEDKSKRIAGDAFQPE